MFSRKTRVSSGVNQLDRLLGGLFIGDNVIWYDDAGSLAPVFSLNFVQESQTHEKPLIYITFDRSPRTLIQELGPLAESRHLTILDCFTHGRGDSSEVFSQFYEKDGAQWPYQIIQVKEPWKPKRVTEAINQLHKGLKADVRFVFDSLTGMQDLWEGEEQILRFYSRSCPRLYELGTVAYWIVEEKAHSAQLKARINQIAQVAVELSLKRGKSTLTVLKAGNRRPQRINRPNRFWCDGMTVTFDTDKSAAGPADIGLRLKSLRQKQGLSQKELARLVGVTPSTISQVESNSIYPSLPALFKMAEVLGVQIGSIFQNGSGATRRTVFAGKGRDVNFSDLPKGSIQGKTFLPADFEGRAEPYLVEIPPKKKLGSHFLVHKGEEFGYVLSGKLQVVINNITHHVRAGDVVYLTDDTPGQWSNPGPRTAKLLWVKLK